MQDVVKNQETLDKWHSESVEWTLNHLNSSEEGLSVNEANIRFQKNGPNQLPKPPRRSALIRFLLQFNNILIYVLLIAAVTTALLDHLIDSFVILAVVLVNALIGFFQEGKAEQAMEAIRDMLAPRAHVIRDGKRQSIEGKQLVTGDIVLIEAGDKVPADLRLFITYGLQIQESVLTGESIPTDKSIESVNIDAAVGDRSCIAYSGTLVTSGQAKGIVIATGSKTEIGRISEMLMDIGDLTTPLVKQMNVFAKWLTGFILFISSMILIFGYLVQNLPFTDLFMIVVGLSVAAIPEGLPAVLTITLAIGVQAMAKKNAIVRKLPAIETLGSVSVICTDKTGTLTRNEMMVSSVVTDKHCFLIDGTGYEMQGMLTLDKVNTNPADHTILEKIAEAAILCNDASIRELNGILTVEGDPMEGALLSFAGKMGASIDTERKNWTRTDTIPFDSKHRFMATLNHNHKGKAYITVKGAPERLLEMCTEQWVDVNKTKALDLEYWQSRINEIAGKGERILALAIKPMDSNHTVLEYGDLENGMILVGMVGIIDPPREEAANAIMACHQAGISVKMITGDHAITAAAIGKKIGLKRIDNVLTGAEIDLYGEEKLKKAVLETDIFARTSPEHKLRLVTTLQSLNQIVAMTGDGVNDAPALKRADVGIAMGNKGSEAAKEASVLVLADDNFTSIVSAIKKGRTVYDNLKKVITFLLPVNGGESLSLIIAILFGLILPITPVQILWINMVSSVGLAMALAFEPSEPQVMKRPPRSADTPILAPFLIWRITFVSILFSIGVFGQFFLSHAQYNDLDTARTMTVNTLVAIEIFYLFSVRRSNNLPLSLNMLLGTKAILLAISIVTVLQLLFTYSPIMHNFFATQPLSLLQLTQVILFGITVLIILESEKILIRQWNNGTLSFI